MGWQAYRRGPPQVESASLCLQGHDTQTGEGTRPPLYSSMKGHPNFPMKVLFVISFSALALTAATREYPQSCAAIFPAASATMTAAGFEPKVSDSAGGVLSMNYAGQPMVYNFFVKHANPFLAKYVESGEKLKNKYRGLSFIIANFSFAAKGAGCKAELTVGLAGLDTAPGNRDAIGKYGAWQRTARPLPSNGVAETEFFDQIAAKIKSQ